jgi:hypothetical protein
MNIREYRVIVNLINDYQSDGCLLKIDGVNLTKLREKIMAKSKKTAKKGTSWKAMKGMK